MCVCVCVCVYLCIYVRARVCECKDMLKVEIFNFKRNEYKSEVLVA